jgi:hypothetical protein
LDARLQVQKDQIITILATETEATKPAESGIFCKGGNELRRGGRIGGGDEPEL